MTEIEQADLLGNSNANSHPEQDSVGGTYEGLLNGERNELENLINVSTVFLQLAKEIKVLKGF